MSLKVIGILNDYTPKIKLKYDKNKKLLDKNQNSPIINTGCPLQGQPCWGQPHLVSTTPRIALLARGGYVSAETARAAPTFSHCPL